MAETAWILVDSREGIEFREIGPEGSTTLQKRTTQTFSRRKIYTGGTGPTSLDAGTTASTVSATSGSVTISSSGDYTCTDDALALKGEPGTDIMERTQTWQTYGDWEAL